MADEASADLAADGDVPPDDEALGDTLRVDSPQLVADGDGDVGDGVDALATADGAGESPANVTVKQGSAQKTRDAARDAARKEAAAQRDDWKNVGEQVKPPHLRVPAGVASITDRLTQPLRQEDSSAAMPPRHANGLLQQRANVEPTVIRSFIHKVDKNHDDLIEPRELADLSVKHSMGITEDQIQAMFEAIIQQRPPGKRHNCAVSWQEIYAEMKLAKRWASAMDISVMCEDGDYYHIAVEPDALDRWCRSMYDEFRPAYPDLAYPEDPDSFLTSVLSVSNPKDGKMLQCEAKVQNFLKKQTDKSADLLTNPRLFALCSVAGQRQAWAYDARPYRNMWLCFFRAVGLRPLQPIEPDAVKRDRLAAAQAATGPMKPANVVRAIKKSHAGTEGKVRVCDPKPKVAIRTDQASDPAVAPQLANRHPPHPGEEKRAHSETLVNASISRSAGADALDSGYRDAGADAAEQSGAVSVSFAARRKLLQVQAKQHRDSEAQKFLGSEKALARQQSLLGQAGASVAAVGVTFRGPHSHLGFSHHHLTNSVEPSRMKYEKNMAHSWDGAHIDHTKHPPQNEDVKLSKMGPAEREAQFGTYFAKQDNQRARVDALHGVKDIMDNFKPWQNHEYRPDHATRHGKYGRRVFDPQVRETPVGHTISGLDSKPMEEFHRQQELVHEFLDRSLPPTQHKHFENYLPPAEFPYRKEVPMV